MRRRLAVTTAVVALIAGCTESTGPPAAAPPDRVLAVWSGVASHILRQATTAPPLEGFLAVADSSGAESHILTLAATARPSEETYQMRFWVVEGRRTSVDVDYVGGKKFLRLEFPADALLLWPDGTGFQDGEGIQVTLTIDRTRILVYLEPEGLVFSDASPVRLNIWYANADADLNRDGQVDGTDATIEQGSLGMWYQASPGLPWVPWPADHIKSEKRFQTNLYHFSGYAVSW